MWWSRRSSRATKLPDFETASAASLNAAVRQRNTAVTACMVTPCRVAAAASGTRKLALRFRSTQARRLRMMDLSLPPRRTFVRSSLAGRARTQAAIVAAPPSSCCTTSSKPLSENGLTMQGRDFSDALAMRWGSPDISTTGTPERSAEGMRLA